MRYKSFRIENYRAIDDPITLPISSKTLIPLVGINECGKTTILQAVFAFDFINDAEYNGQHLQNTLNLYKTADKDPLITAQVEMAYDRLQGYWESLRASQPAMPAQAIEPAQPIQKSSYAGFLHLIRNLKTKQYSIQELQDASAPFQDKLARLIIKHLPYILYNDDFQDRPPESLLIPSQRPPELSGWLAVYERLFNATNREYSLFSVVKETDARRRDSIVSDVQAKLNGTLSKAWQTFLLDKNKNISVRLDVASDPGNANPRLEVSIVENIGSKERFFKVVDRSKGFLWFFNFVMKLEFNPKVSEDKADTIYLLDEPGSYLHSAAQEKLSAKLKSISENQGHVIYCTHSHHLLDPRYIPPNNIYIVSKLPKKNIAITPLPLVSTKTEKTTALQPVFEALQIAAFDLSQDEMPILAVEGIYDKYAIELFLPESERLRILPGANADSILKNIPVLIAFRKKYVALWDNDEEGRRVRKRADTAFGPHESQHFDVLPSCPGGANRKMEDMVSAEDLAMIKSEIGLAEAASYESALLALCYANKTKKQAILRKISRETKENFGVLHKIINKRFSAECAKDKELERGD